MSRRPVLNYLTSAQCKLYLENAWFHQRVDELDELLPWIIGGIEQQAEAHEKAKRQELIDYVSPPPPAPEPRPELPNPGQLVGKSRNPTKPPIAKRSVGPPTAVIHCPSCGAELLEDEGKTHFFCAALCGASIPAAVIARDLDVLEICSGHRNWIRTHGDFENGVMTSRSMPVPYGEA